MLSKSVIKIKQLNLSKPMELVILSPFKNSNKIVQMKVEINLIKSYNNLRKIYAKTNKLQRRFLPLFHKKKIYKLNKNLLKNKEKIFKIVLFLIKRLLI